MNKFAGLPFEKCWNCKNMQCKVQAVTDPDSKIRQGNYYHCNSFDDTLDVAWKHCAGSKFKSRDEVEQGETELAIENKFDPIKRTQQINEMSWNDIRQLAKSYDIALMVDHLAGNDRPTDDEKARAKWRTKQDLIKLILQYESSKNSES